MISMGDDDQSAQRRSACHLEIRESEHGPYSPPKNANPEGTRVSFLKTELAFYLWLVLLLGSLATFALGLLGHIVTLFAAPWLSLGTQATIHATIPVLLTAVKLITVPLLIFLTPFARHHKTFKSWTNWIKARFHQAYELMETPRRLVQAIYSWFVRRRGPAAGRQLEEGKEVALVKTESDLVSPQGAHFDFEGRN